MGKAIEKIALKKGHEIVVKIDTEDSIDALVADDIDIAIEFT